MPTGTYQRGADVHAHFNQEEYDEFDAKGKANTKEFLNAVGYDVMVNDKTDDGRTLFTNTDLRAIHRKKKNILFPEAEVKRDKHWGYIYSGVDVPTRKLKYYRPGVPSAVYMSNASNTAMLEIRFDLLKLAEDACGEEWLGVFGYRSSANFVMPDHGCHKIKKNCKGRSTGESFFRIPYKYVRHFVKTNGVWTLEKDAEPVSQGGEA